jgi:hypothetical protein
MGPGDQINDIETGLSRLRRNGHWKVTFKQKATNVAAFVISTYLLKVNFSRSVEIAKGCIRSLFCLSGRRDSNPRPRPWQGRALPTELLPQLHGQK